jgi:hypothetical protein
MTDNEAVAALPESEAPTGPADDLAAAIGSAFDTLAGATDEAQDGPQRDERGRFASADTDEEAKPDDQSQAEAAEEASAAEAPQPPARTPLDEVLDTYKPLYAARGIAPDQAMRSLFEAQKVLEERPVEAIQVLARQYGVDLRQFVQPQQPPAQAQAPAQPNDPAMAAVMAEVKQLKDYIQAQQQQTVQAEDARVQESIAAFASDPKHSHFPTVRTMMGALMQAGTAKDLATAYEMACRAHPEVFAATQKSAAEAKAKTDNAGKAKAAADARNKAASVRGSVPVPGNAVASKSLDALLEAAWESRLN